MPMASQLDNEDGGRAFLKIHSQRLTTDTCAELRQRRDRANSDTQRLLVMAALKSPDTPWCQGMAKNLNHGRPHQRHYLIPLD